MVAEHVACAGLDERPEGPWYCTMHRNKPSVKRKRSSSVRRSAEPQATPPGTGAFLLWMVLEIELATHVLMLDCAAVSLSSAFPAFPSFTALLRRWGRHGPEVPPDIDPKWGDDWAAVKYEQAETLRASVASRELLSGVPRRAIVTGCACPVETSQPVDEP